ncbi:ParA family protein [Desulfuromonas carbonis]|nr:ParA family protein [Desulfuromonas sp. DDH964]
MSQLYVVTIASEKGGVGKTTLATNLAIYLKALCEDLPVTLFSFDNHFSVDRMFRIGQGTPRGDVADLLQGTPAEALVELGEYGVQFIPSRSDLTSLRERLTTPDLLARMLCAAQLTGVLIIDTRPDLDHFTRNALYAADRVIVPVKDMASLENCRNLYAFFAEQGLSKKALRILPCLVDSRIHFDGPFRDSYQLLKGYAINRGYRCLEGYIAKSPKVESLNTNPDGKIYPVITHGRGTEVHIQFSHLARQVFLDLRDCNELRLSAIALEQERRSQERSSAFAARLAKIAPGCLLCDRELVGPGGVESAGYFAATGSGSLSGFLDEECYSELVFRHIFQSSREGSGSQPLRELFRESAQRSYFVLRRAPGTRNFFRQQLSFYRFDESGLEVSHRVIDLDGLGRETENPLQRLALRTLCDQQGRLGDDFLLVRRVSSDVPEEILYDEAQEAFREAGRRIASQFY